MITDIQKAIAELACKISLDNSHGYSQPNRLGDGTVSEYYLNSIGKTVFVHGGDYDCSSMVWEILKTLNLIKPVNNLWTGNMQEVLLENKFMSVNLNKVQNGDILLRTGHTEVYIGDELTVGFVRSENYSIDGKTGNQDGGEAGIHEFVKSNWKYAFRYYGESGSEIEVPEMCCIIKLNNSTGHWYFDGQKLHILSSPDELLMLDEIHKANNGKEMPRVYWNQEKLDKFFKFLR